MSVLETCSTINPEATIAALKFAALPERMHAELIARIARGHEKAARKLLSRVGVYSQDALQGLFPQHVIDSLMASSRSNRLDSARANVKRVPAKVAENIFSYGLVHEQDRVEIAVACARRAPRAIADNLLAFGIYSDAGRKSVAAALIRNTAESVREAIKTCGVTSEADIQDLVVPLAVIRPRVLAALGQITREPWPLRFFTNVFAQALTQQRWDSAFDIGKIAAATALGREPRQSESLRYFDILVEEIKKLPTLSDDTTYNISLLERARRAGTLPEGDVLRAFTIFDESTDSFIVEVLQQAGPSAGANIVEEMTRVYRKKGTIPDADRTIIREFISSGFSGFSRASLRDAKKAFAKSPEIGRQLLASWKSASSAILHGTAIDKDLEEAPFFANLVYSAYRPVDLTVQEVKDLLPTIPDNSHHLLPWRYPSTGYPIQLVELDELRLKPDETIDLNALRATAACITGGTSAPIACSHDEFVQILVKASQRGIDSINKGKLVGFLANHTADVRVQGTIREISQLLVENLSAQQAAEAIEKMKAFYTVVYGDMLDVALRAYFEGGRLELRDQFKARIRAIRKLAPEAELTIEQIRHTVREELDKVWRHERTLLNRESKKFTNQIATMHAEYRIYLSKTRSAFFGRAGAGLCTHDDTWSWKQENFRQMIMVDERKSRIVGNIQLHIFTAPDEKRAVLARLNPTEKFLLTVSKKTLATAMLSCVEIFARDNELVPYLPGDDDGQHLLTNRETFAPLLRARYGERFEHSIKVAGWLDVKEICRLVPLPPQAASAPTTAIK